jgi:hypothetical protein
MAFVRHQPPTAAASASMARSRRMSLAVGCEKSGRTTATGASPAGMCRLTFALMNSATGTAFKNCCAT